MIRWFLLIPGMMLVLISVFFAYCRTDEYTSDSTSVVVIKNTSHGYALVEYDFIHRQKILFTTGASIKYFEWSADGEWLLVITDHPQSNMVEIWRVPRTGRPSQMLYTLVDWNLLDRVRISPKGNEFVFFEQDVTKMRASPVVYHMSIAGDVLGEYPLEGEVGKEWQLRWHTAETIQLTRPLSEFGYVINITTKDIQQVEVNLNDQIRAALNDLHVAPNEKWRIVADGLNLTLAGYGLDPTSVWLHASNTLYFHPIVGWSLDSQQIAVNAEAVPLGLTSGATDIYITSIDAPHLQRLTNDARRKGFIVKDTLYEFNVRPFSYEQQWVLFGNSGDPHRITVLHAVRTNGSGQEVTNLVPPGDRIFAAQWSPPRPSHIFSNLSLFFGGFGLIFATIGLTWWSWRRRIG